MAGERAKENVTLQAPCEGCGKELSVELLRGVVTGVGRKRRIAALCEACESGGWSAEAS